MAYPWIKVRIPLWTDDRVRRIANLVRLPRAHVVGALVRLWCVADEHSVDGRLLYSPSDIDDECETPGLADALQDPEVQWLHVLDDGVQVPDFEVHNGSSAKRRAQHAKRTLEARKRRRQEAHIERTVCAPDKKKKLTPQTPLARGASFGCASGNNGTAGVTLPDPPPPPSTQPPPAALESKEQASVAIQDAYREVYGADKSLPSSWLRAIRREIRAGNGSALDGVTATAIRSVDAWRKTEGIAKPIDLPMILQYLAESDKDRTLRASHAREAAREATISAKAAQESAKEKDRLETILERFRRLDETDRAEWLERTMQQWPSLPPKVLEREAAKAWAAGGME